MFDQAQLNWITNFIWNIADDCLRDVFVRGKHRKQSRGHFTVQQTVQ